MNAIEEVQRLRAIEAGRAMPVASVRHVRLAERPLMILAYHLAGDEGAPVAFLLGNERGCSKAIVIGEPRNRDLRFAALRQLAEEVARYCAGFSSLTTELRRVRAGESVPVPVAVDAPQLVFANSPSAHWVCGLLGRALRHLATTGERGVDPSIPALGRDLSFFSDNRKVVGQSIVLVGTELAPLHWATGQTPTEDQNINSLAAWIAPERVAARSSGAATWPDLLSSVENFPAAGPVPEPQWDADVLAPLVADYDEAARVGMPVEPALNELTMAVREAFDPAWHATWDVLDELRALPEGAHVASRWDLDRQAWGYHMQRVNEDRAWFRRVPTPVQAARLLAENESSLARVTRQMALDDRLVASRWVVDGEAVQGRVVDLDLAHRELGPSGQRHVHRPLISIRAESPCDIPLGAMLNWSERAQLTVRITEISDDGLTVRLMVTGGQGRGAVQPNQLPTMGSISIFGPWPADEYYPSTLPSQVPWTHSVAEQADATADDQ